MKLGVILYSNEPDIMETAFDLSSSALRGGDSVSMFLLGNGVDIESTSGKIVNYARRFFKPVEKMQAFVESGGNIYSSSSCLAARELDNPKLCTALTMDDLYKMMKQNDHIITF
jgi:hypothetical protein